MKKSNVTVTLSLALLAVVAFGASDAFAASAYEVTITNITRGQVITPPLVISHNKGFELYTLGSPAIPELATMAEEGDTGPLQTFLATQSDVYAFTAGGAPLFPGESMTLEVAAGHYTRFISVVGMLAVTNDAFFAVKGARVSLYGPKSVSAAAYDAGSEGNNESCDYVPGPPCGSAGARDTENAEGFVHVHSGIHGGADLDPAMYDWNNPTAQITIRPLN